MIVYVVITGAYSQRGVGGVCSTLEKAQESITHRNGRPVKWEHYKTKGYESWTAIGEEAEIEPFVVDGEAF